MIQVNDLVVLKDNFTQHPRYKPELGDSIGKIFKVTWVYTFRGDSLGYAELEPPIHPYMKSVPVIYLEVIYTT